MQGFSQFVGAKFGLAIRQQFGQSGHWRYTPCGIRLESQQLFALPPFKLIRREQSVQTLPGDRLPKNATQPIDPELTVGFSSPTSPSQRKPSLTAQNMQGVEEPLSGYCVEKLAFSLRQTKATKIDLQNRSIFNDRWHWKGRSTPKKSVKNQEPSFSTQ